MEKYVAPKDSDEKDYALVAARATVGSIPVARAALTSCFTFLSLHR